MNGDPIQPLQRGEAEGGLPIRPGFREMIEKALARQSLIPGAPRQKSGGHNTVAGVASSARQTGLSAISFSGEFRLRRINFERE